jgi:hypothetical protein
MDAFVAKALGRVKSNKILEIRAIVC